MAHRLFRAVIILVIFYSAMSVTHAQDSCGDVLKDIRNNLITSKTVVSQEVYKRYFYNLTDQQAYEEYSKVHDSSNDSSGMFQVTIPIDDVPVTPKGQGQHSEKLSESDFYERYHTWKQTVRDQIESERFYDERNYYEASNINTPSITAWENCMAQGLFVYASRSTTDTVMLKVFYKTPTTLSARFVFVTPAGITVDIPDKNEKIHGSKVFRVSGNVNRGFSISVNGQVVDAQNKKVEDISAFDVKVGPPVLTPLRNTYERPPQLLLLQIKEIALSNDDIFRGNPWHSGATINVAVEAEITDRQGNKRVELLSQKGTDDSRDRASTYAIGFNMPVKLKRADFSVRFRISVDGEKRGVFGTPWDTFDYVLTNVNGVWQGASSDYVQSRDIEARWQERSFTGKLTFRVMLVNNSQVH
jgi:hypothetical protein